MIEFRHSNFDYSLTTYVELVAASIALAASAAALDENSGLKAPNPLPIARDTVLVVVCEPSPMKSVNCGAAKAAAMSVVVSGPTPMRSENCGAAKDVGKNCGAAKAVAVTAMKTMNNFMIEFFLSLQPGRPKLTDEKAASDVYIRRKFSIK